MSAALASIGIAALVLTFVRTESAATPEPSAAATSVLSDTSTSPVATASSVAEETLPESTLAPQTSVPAETSAVTTVPTTTSTTTETEVTETEVTSAPIDTSTTIAPPAAGAACAFQAIVVQSDRLNSPAVLQVPPPFLACTLTAYEEPEGGRIVAVFETIAEACDHWQQIWRVRNEKFEVWPVGAVASIDC